MKPGVFLRRLPRNFSLQFFMGAIVIFCLSLSLFLVHRKLIHATSELTTLRSELGFITVVDPAKVNFIAVPQHQDLTWRWRVLLPAGTNYRVNFRTTDIHNDDFPSPTSVFFVPGETEFSLNVICHRDLRDEWKITATSTTGHVQKLGFLSKRHRNWMKGNLTHSHLVQGRGKTMSEDVREPVELLRLHIMNEDETQSTDGLLVWITK